MALEARLLLIHTTIIAHLEWVEAYVRAAAGPLLCAPPPPELVAAVDLALQNNQGALEALRLL